MSTGNQVNLSDYEGRLVDIFISKSAGGGGYLKYTLVSAGRNGVLIEHRDNVVFVPVHVIRSIEIEG